ncbi:MAG: ABC transporter six-transmembrane domain-containing protein [Bacteroidota bacterium]
MKLSLIFSEFRWKFILNFFLILSEAIIELLFPLFIGFAIDDAIKGEYLGALQLGGLGVAIIFIGGGRRFFDSRFYAQVYQKLGRQIMSRLKEEDASVKSARLSMISEVVEFLENSLPELLANVIGMVGVVIIIIGLNIQVFLWSLLATVLVFLIYFLTRKKTLRLNAAYNDEIEKQVKIIHSNDSGRLSSHLQNLMKWNIKLSDLEVVNFSVSWIVLICFLVISIMLSAGTGTVEYGALFSLIMYVFQYIGSVIALPFFYQSWLRLSEIRQRLEEI